MAFLFNRGRIKGLTSSMYRSRSQYCINNPAWPPAYLRKQYSSSRVLLDGPQKINSKPLLKELLKDEKFDRVLENFKTQRKSVGHIQLSMMFSGFGRAKSKHIELKKDPRFQDYVDHVKFKLKSPYFFDVQGIANIIHAAAKMNLKSPELNQLIDDKVPWLVA